MRNGQRALLLVIAGLLCMPLAAQSESPTGFDTAEYDKATQMILCDCGCHPQSVHDCACGRAAEMRVEIQGLISQGMSGDEVIARYVDQSGDQIRIVPTAEGFNLVAWLGPLLALLLGSALTFYLIRRSTRAASAGTTEPGEPLPAPPPSEDGAYQQRLRDALENLE